MPVSSPLLRGMGQKAGKEDVDAIMNAPVGVRGQRVNAGGSPVIDERAFVRVMLRRRREGRGGRGEIHGMRGDLTEPVHHRMLPH